MANKISVVIDVAVDKANAGLKSFRQSIQDADGAAGKFKAGTQSVGQSIAANIGPPLLVAGAAVATFAAKSIAAASDLSESTNAVNKSFGKASESVLEVGENSAKSFGLSKAAFNEAAVAFSSFAQTVAGPGGDVAATIEAMTTRAADFASVMNIEVAEASTVFRSGLSGETEPLKKFGIDLSAAAVEAYALSTGLVKSKSEMTEAIKVQARYGLLMQKTSKFAGDFADTSDGLANSTRIAQARLTDFQAELGGKLLPVVASASNAMLDLADAAEALGGALGPVDDGLIKLIKTNYALFNPVGQTITLWNKLKGSGDDAAESTDAFTARMYQMQGAARGAAVTAEELAASTDEVTRSAKDAADAITDQREAQEAATEAALEAIDSSLAYRNQQAQTNQTIRDTSIKMAMAKKGSEEYSAAAREQEGAVLNLAAAAVAQAEANAEAAGETLSASEKTAIYRAELLRMSEYLNGDAAIAIAMHADRLNKIPKSIMTNIGVSSRTGDFIGGSINGRRAAGGPVSAGGAYLVGENGPELLQMGSSSGNVIPNNKIGTTGGGVNITINAGLGTDPIQLGRVVQDALNKYARSGGR